jgi:hypothetical protein
VGEAADLHAALVALLLEDPAIAAIVGTRVFGGELPANEAKSMPRAAIVVAASGGASLTGDSFTEHDTQRVDLFAYAGTPSAAEQLRGQAALALRRVRRGVWGGCLIHWIKPAGGSTGARDPDAAWPRAFQSFQVMHGLVAVT